MNLAALIAELADQTDGFLAGVCNRTQARTVIAEQLDLEHFELSPANRAAVSAGVMAALEAEEFFGVEFVGDPFSDNQCEDPEP